jgi:hypothetical protein
MLEWIPAFFQSLRQRVGPIQKKQTKFLNQDNSRIFLYGIIQNPDISVRIRFWKQVRNAKKLASSGFQKFWSGREAKALKEGSS